MHDNAQVHIYHRILKMLEKAGIELLKWPPYFPDLNPIEYISPILQNDLHKHHPHLATMTGAPKKIKTALIPALKHYWDLIETSVFQNLARTMSNKVTAVIEAKGCYTKY